MGLRKLRRQAKQIRQPAKARGVYSEKYLQDIMRAHSGDMALCMYYMFGICLHREFGFGAIRLSRLYNAVDKEMKGWGERKFNRKELERTLFEETGIDYRG